MRKTRADLTWKNNTLPASYVSASKNARLHFRNIARRVIGKETPVSSSKSDTYLKFDGLDCKRTILTSSMFCERRIGILPVSANGRLAC